jgi:hypothetical protein
MSKSRGRLHWDANCCLIPHYYKICSVPSSKAVSFPMPNMTSIVDALDALPNDILSIVTTEFDLADLCNLRLTSQNLHTLATTPEFQSRFHHVRTDLTSDNLRSLIAVCQSPNLSHLIKEVTILAKHYDDHELKQQIKEGRRWVAEKANAPFFHSTAHDLTSEEKADVQNMVEQIAKLKADQVAMQTDGSDIKLLTEAFDSLGKRDIALTIEAAVYIQPNDVRSPISSARDNEGMARRMEHAFKAAIAAFSNTSLQVTALTVFNMSWGGYVGLKGFHDAFVSTDDSPPSIPSALHNLQSLTLNLAPAPSKEIGKRPSAYGEEDHPVYGPAASEELNNAHLESVTALLCPSAHSLRHIDIRFRGSHKVSLDCAAIFSKLAASYASFTQLTSLQLRNLIIDANDLVTILRKTPSLTHLGLHRVSTPENPSHPVKVVEYPNSEPAWGQAEPDVAEWKDAWMPLFKAFIGPLPNRLCPNLLELETMGLSLTSGKHRVYFTAPEDGLVRYISSVAEDEEKKKKHWYKLQAFQEGLHVAVLTGDEVHGITPVSEDNDAKDGTEVYQPTIRNTSAPTPWQLRHDQATENPEKVRGITYRVATTRPLGSPAYYNWIHYYSVREFAERGCSPPDSA